MVMSLILYLIMGMASFFSMVTTISPFSPSSSGSPDSGSMISTYMMSPQMWMPLRSSHSVNMGPACSEVP